jgi:hypothetical protein
MSPVKRERESNREIPELFSYVSNSLYKSCQESGKSFYEQHGIRKFGYWLGDSKKTTHQELEELMGAGSASKMIKAFNKTDIPCQVFVIFTTGGIDFVGGFTYYNFLKTNLTQKDWQAKVELAHSNGEEIHSHVFDQAKTKTPAHWKAMMSYY